MADWRVDRGVRSVALQSTGVYWMPVCEILQRHGLDVFLVNARHTKNLPGRKSGNSFRSLVQKMGCDGFKVKPTELKRYIVDGAKKKILGIGGKTTFRVGSVEAVDGQKVAIRATRARSR